jgi:hypothetical protein
MNPTMNKTSDRVYDNAAQESERTYAMFLHLAGLISMLEWVTSIVSIAVVGIMWAVRKNDSPFLDDHGKEAFNFQLSLLVWFVLGIVLSPIGIGVVILTIGIPVLRLVGCIRGAIAAHKGEFYRYPMCFRFIS